MLSRLTIAGARKSNGFTLIELMLVVGVIGILAAIAVPGLMRARLTANEASAVGAMRTISSAETVFSSTCGGGGFAVDLADLGLPPLIGGAAFIAPDLAGAFPGGRPKHGYEFTISPGMGTVVLAAADTCNGSTNDTETEFFATGDPIGPTTGARFFGTNQTGLIRQDSAALPDMTAGVPLQ